MEKKSKSVKRGHETAFVKAREGPFPEHQLRISELIEIETPEPENTDRKSFFFSGREDLKQDESETGRLYDKSTKAFTKILWDIEDGKEVDLETLNKGISRLSNKLILDSTTLLTLTTKAGNKRERTDARSAWLERHSLNVSILAMKIGAVLGYNESKMTELGIAALLHDIGLHKLRDLIESPEKLSKKQFLQIKRHPMYSAKMVKKLHLSKHCMQGIEQHHEREDGSGYPSGIKGDRIHEYAKIVGLADIAEALTHRRPYRNALSVFSGVSKTVEDWGQYFEPRIVRALVQILGVYPVGTVVELSTKELAKVVHNDSSFPLRPTVQVFESKLRDCTVPTMVNLAENRNLYIMRVVEEGNTGGK